MCSDIWGRRMCWPLELYTPYKNFFLFDSFVMHHSFANDSFRCSSSSHFAPPRNVWQMFARCTCHALKCHWLQRNTHLSWKWCCGNSSREKVNSFFMTPQLLWLYHLLANICLYWMPPSGDAWSMCTPWHSPFVFTILSYLLLELQEGSEIYSLDSVLQIILCLLDDGNVWNYFWKAAFSLETLVVCLLRKSTRANILFFQALKTKEVWKFNHVFKSFLTFSSLRYMLFFYWIVLFLSSPATLTTVAPVIAIVFKDWNNPFPDPTIIFLCFSLVNHLVVIRPLEFMSKWARTL